jgi:putative ABC transport system permease protein
MNFRKLYRKNIAHYSRYYRLIAAATVITVAVIIGSIVVGDSVRATLENIVRERLGNTETIVFANNSFMDEAMTRNPVFGDKARGILLSNGFVSNDGALLPVFVWGVSDMDIPAGSAKINEPLAKELKPTMAAGIVLRLPAAGLIPSGSLFVTENYTTSMRLDFAGVVDAKSGGNISMKNEQTLPLNIFVNRDELAELMQTEGKINLLLTDKAVSEADLSKAWTYVASGLSVHNRGAFTEVVSDRVFLQADVTKSIVGNNPVPNRLYSYLANAITFGNDSIPYSFVTALDRYMGEALAPDEVILTDYSANRLHAKVGDKVRLSYFTARDMKTLVTGYKTFTVKRILPISLLKDDPTLSATFPGLSDVERCTEWDSDLPINMSLITNEDERYWEVYRSIPKALVSYAAIEAEWSNPFGDATAVRVHTPTPDLSMLTPQMFGLQLIRPREAGFAAARNGVDFSSLFLALGCFIIAAAVLLMITPLSEMLYRRRDEIRLMQALGFKQKRIRDMLMGEAVPVLFVCGIAGIVAGLLYTLVVMWLLGNVWSGATHASDFSFGFTPSLLSVAICFGPLLGLCVVWPVISKALKKHDSQDRWQSHPAICATVKTGGKVVPQLARRSRQVAKSSRNLRDDQDRWQSRPATCAATKTGGKVVPPSARPSGQVADTSPLPPPKEGDKHLPPLGGGTGRGGLTIVAGRRRRSSPAV